MKIFHCSSCQQTIYFENTLCLSCQHELGFLPDLKVMSPLQKSQGAFYVATYPYAHFKKYKKCRNYLEEDVCNWMIPEYEAQEDYCFSCRLNIAIPNLGKPDNRKYWYRLEQAKRRLLYTLLELKLPFISRKEDSQKGLGFQFLEDENYEKEQKRTIFTGHESGVITINVAEANTALRVQERLKMQEKYRTLLGHFRHESGHYYWMTLIEGTPYQAKFRERFGDDSLDYQKALQSYYEKGAQPNWQKEYVSKYATSHPWEDWAETWAHYLHMVDTLETAQAWGLTVQPKNQISYQLVEQSIYDQYEWKDFETMYQHWVLLTCAFNSMNRSMGQRDFYPFTLSSSIFDKLTFVDELIKASAIQDAY